MIKLFAIKFILLSWFLIGLVSTSFANEGDVLFSDDFNDGNFNGWTIESGQWWINNSNLVGAKSGKVFDGKIYTGNPEWDNYRIELNVNGFQGIDQGIGFRYTQNSYYEVNLRYGTGEFDTPQVKLWKYDSSGQILLVDTHSFPLINQKWYFLKIETLNENIKVWIDNTLVFDFTDTGTNIKKGAVTLSYWAGDVSVAYMRFDNIKITALAPPPKPRLPVVFIPGIGGSEMKATQDIVWSADDGRGGNFTRAYPANEKVWVNQDEAVKLGDDDYFDVLRLKSDGVTPEADVSLTGNLTPFGYSEIDSFFTGMGYVKNTNFFVFPYDWRKDVRTTQADLDSLIEIAKQKTGLSKVNIVVHSLGGLVARNYISDASKASKVNKLIELGVPHLGAVYALKSLLYGTDMSYRFKFFEFPVIPGSEIKDVVQNFPSHLSLTPSVKYYDFYNNSTNNPYPFKDGRDIDNNKETGDLNFDQLKTLLTNLGHNMTVFSIGEQFHNLIDPILNQTNGTKVYEIVGSSQPTLGQIHETWWITWPINFLPKTDEIFINGDDTVPLYSASLKNDSLDLSGAYKIYYVDQKHSDLVSANGTAMQTVRSILDDDNSLPVDVKDQKISLEGQQISVDQDADLDIYDENGRHTGLDETNIPNTFYDSLGKIKHIFVKKSAPKVTVKVRSTKATKTNIKIRNYSQDSINKTIFYNDVPVSTSSATQFIIDPTNPVPPTDIGGITPSEATGSAALDQTPPVTQIQISGTKNSSGIYTGPVTITLTGIDTDSGILKIEYSLDNGQTVQTYTKPFTISIPGQTIIQFKAIDKLGNEEIPQSIAIEIAAPPNPTPSSTPSPTPSASQTPEPSQSPTQSPEPTPTPQIPILPVILQTIVNTPKQDTLETPEVLGTSFRQPNLSLKRERKVEYVYNQNKSDQFLDGLLLVLGGIFALMLLGFFTKFLKPSPKQMNYPKPKKYINYLHYICLKRIIKTICYRKTSNFTR